MGAGGGGCAAIFEKKMGSGRLRVCGRLCMVEDVPSAPQRTSANSSILLYNICTDDGDDGRAFVFV